MAIENFDRCVEAVSFSWPVVQCASDLVTVGLGEPVHGGFLGNVLAYETIRIFVGTSFPGVVRSGEVNSCAGELLDLTISVELGSIVCGDGLEKVRVAADELKKAVVECGDGTFMELADQNAAGEPLDEADDAVFASLADDSIDLPVADLSPPFCCRRSLGDVSFSGHPATPFVGAVAFAVLGPLPQVPVESSTALLVLPDVPVDGFVTDLEGMVAAK